MRCRPTLLYVLNRVARTLNKKQEFSGYCRHVAILAPRGPRDLLQRQRTKEKYLQQSGLALEIEVVGLAEHHTASPI